MKNAKKQPFSLDLLSNHEVMKDVGTKFPLQSSLYLLTVCFSRFDMVTPLSPHVKSVETGSVLSQEEDIFPIQLSLLAENEKNG